MSSLRKLASQTAIYGISSILGRFVNWALTPLYTNYFSNGEYGATADLYAWTTYFLVILTFGMETAYFRYLGDKDDGKNLYKDAFLFVGMLASGFLVVSLIFSGPIASMLDYGDQPVLIMLVAGIIFLDVVAWMPMARLRQEEQARKFVTITMVNIGVNVVLNLIFIAWLKMGVEYVFVSNLIASGVKLAMCLPQSLPSEWRPDMQAIRNLSSFGFYIMIAGLLGMMVQNLEKNLIPHLWPENAEWRGAHRSGFEMLGLYSAGFRLAMIIQLATQAFRYAADPFFFRLAQQKNSRAVLARAFHYYWIVILVSFLFVSTFRFEIASFSVFHHSLIGPAFWPGLDVVPISLLAYCLFGAYQQISIWFKMTKQTRFGILFSATGVLVVLVGNIITIPWLGYMGSAVASLAAFAIMTWWVYVTGQKYYPVPYRMDRALTNAVLFIGAWVLCEYVESFWARAFLCLLTVFACYVIDRVNPIRWKEPGAPEPEVKPATPQGELRENRKRDAGAGQEENK